MYIFTIAVLFTLSISAFCSLCEGLVLSSTNADIENLKKRHKRKGQILENCKKNIEETTSAILTLNTLANTLGAMIVGGLSTEIFGKESLWVFSSLMTLSVLLFAEILPKNIGILYRPSILDYLAYPLFGVCYIMQPFTLLCKQTLRFFLKKKTASEEADQEILLLAEKSAKEGTLSTHEKNMIFNTLSLDNIFVSDIMTPRNVVVSFEKKLTIKDIFAVNPAVPFSRLPIYDKEEDNIIGLVRRRDIFNAKANGETALTLEALCQAILFVPANVTAADALTEFLKNHQQFAVVVDEFGAVAGVLALEDIVEHIIGQEIFEKDDVAVDMRVLAKTKAFEKNTV